MEDQRQSDEGIQVQEVKNTRFYIKGPEWRFAKDADGRPIVRGPSKRRDPDWIRYRKNMSEAKELLAQKARMTETACEVERLAEERRKARNKRKARR